MIGIEFDIFWSTAEQVELCGLGIETSLEDCELRPVTFYRIGVISNYNESGKNLCIIHSEGQRFITNKSYTEVKKIIEDVSR